MPDLWHTTTLATATAAAAAVVAVQAADGLSDPEKVALQAAAIAQAQRGITGFNDQLLAVELTRLLAGRTEPLGVVWHEPAGTQTARLSKAVATVLTDPVAHVDALDGADRRAARARSLAERLTRLAEGEVADASQWARGEAMIGHGDKVTGWTRRLNPTACQFCRTLAGTPPRNHVHPPEHRIARHEHCFCSQEILVGPLRPGQKWLGKHTRMATANSGQ